MPLQSPQLDDRSFAQLVSEARGRIAARCPEWTDLSAHDPGMVLLEAFAFLTETMLYRFNQLPEKVYVELLRLIGVRQQSPAAARVSLKFSIPQPRPATVVIPRGTRVLARGAAAAGKRITFSTVDEATIAAGQTAVTALALHCDPIDAEVLGTATGRPGLTLRVKAPPIIAPSGDPEDVVIGVAADEQEALGLESRRVGDTPYIVWREVDAFGPIHAGQRVFVADRLDGVIAFAPATRQLDDRGVLEEVPRALAAVPPPGRQIVAWYRRGGGAEGNLPAGALGEATGLVGVAVTNDEPASGGASAESLANALVRGPEEIRSLRRAVTAADFEVLARRIAGVERARAVTAADVWRHARPGTINVLLVPALPPEVRGPDDGGVSAAVLHSYEKEDIRARIQADLDTRRPMGTSCVVSWAKYKTVKVKATLRVRRSADPATIRAQAIASLRRYLTPLTRDDGTAWEFGDPVPTSYVSYLMQRVTGVLASEGVRLVVDEAPSNASSVTADFSQPKTFYAGDGDALYRSLDGGNAWELVARFDGERIDRIESHPQVPGLIAVAGRVLAASGADAKSRLHFSSDCGETWAGAKELPPIEALAWVLRERTPIVFVATDAALFELEVREGASPRLVVVVKDKSNLPMWSVASTVDGRGNWAVAVAPQDASGIYLSRSGGTDDSFEAYGLGAKDIRTLGFQQDGGRTFLWAGLTMPGAVPGGGCFVRELDSAADWVNRSTGWNGGTCFDFAFDGSKVYAGSHRQGVLWLDSSKPNTAWNPSALGCGLPERTETHLFHPVRAVATRTRLEDPQQVLAAIVPPADVPAPARLNAGGVYKSTDDTSFFNASERELAVDSLSLPTTWLFCSGAHEIEVKPL
jgi:hypothetical protein